MTALDTLDALGVAHTTAQTAPRLTAAGKLTATLAKAAAACGYQLDKLEDAARG
jgi:hypothetical protein